MYFGNLEIFLSIIDAPGSLKAAETTCFMSHGAICGERDERGAKG